MDTPKVLVVDDDPWTQRVVIMALRGLNLQTSTADDGTIALAQAIADPPDLVISDVVMPGMCGWTLVRELRFHPQLALTPFIFLTSLVSSEDKLRGFRLGADDYLPKPFQPEELALRVASVLRRSQNLQAGAMDTLRKVSPQRGFNGSLKEIRIASLLVLLELERTTGTLFIIYPEGSQRARVLLHNGRVVGAYIHGGPPLTGAKAVFHVLRWPSGAFEFMAMEVEMADEVGMTTTLLLVEGARLLDEATIGRAGPEAAAEVANRDA